MYVQDMHTVKLRLDTCDRYFKGDYDRMIRLFCDFEEVCNDSGIEMKFDGLDVIYAKESDIYGLCRFASKISTEEISLFHIMTLVIAEAVGESTNFGQANHQWS